MTTAQASPYLTDKIPPGIETSASVSSPVTRSSGISSEQSIREDWQDVIDELIDWGWDAARFEDDGITPPSKEIVSIAINYAKLLRDKKLPPPMTVVPDPNGGIVFERRSANSSEAIHVWDDESVEYRRFKGGKLIERFNLPNQQ